MEIGTIVKVNIPYKLGERRKGKEKRYKEVQGLKVRVYISKHSHNQNGNLLMN